MKKKITIMIPCYNEEGNVESMGEAITEQMMKMPQYDYEIIFRDNASTDNTLDLLKKMTQMDKHIKVIANSINYGANLRKNSFRGHISGDVNISIPCDFQEPPELIPEFVMWWEKGYEVVCGQKTSSDEGRIKYSCRKLYYNIISTFSEIPQYKHISGITLISKRVFELYFEYGYDLPFRFFLPDLGVPVKLIPYKQDKRHSGKSSYNIWRYLSYAIHSLVVSSYMPLRIATLLGLFFSALSFLAGMFYFILKLVRWEHFSMGIAPMVIGMFFIGSIQLFFIGLIGEYIGVILNRVTPSPPPQVKEYINFEETNEQE